MLAARTNWVKAISTFILLYLSSAGILAVILWRLPPKASLQQPACEVCRVLQPITPSMPLLICMKGESS